MTDALLSKPLDDVVEEAKEVGLERVYVVQVYVEHGGWGGRQI